ncbi:MAG: PAS domain-containing sensor histidine kinase [Rhizobiaceae bacterium]
MARSGNWQDRFAAACDRLVHPAVDRPGERSYQRRLIGVLLGAPFLLAGLLSQIFHGMIDNGSLLAVNCLVFALAWIATAVVAATARAALVESALLIVATMVIGLAVSVTGLLQSPLVLLLLAPPFECWWMHRARGPSNRGWWASIAACALALVAIGGGYGGEVSFAVEHWVLPLIYAATMWLRFTGPPAIPESGGRTLDAWDYENAAEIAGAAVFRLTSDGDVDQVTRQARTMIGVPQALLLGRGLFERLHVTDRVEYMALIADVRADGGRRSAELRLRLPNDEAAENASNFHTFLFEFVRETDTDTVLVLVSDHPEIARLRAAVADARDRADGMEIAKGRFLASVSHELRTPLNAIIGFADMLKNELLGPLPDARQKEYVQLISESGNHLLSVVNAILDVSKIESGNYLIEPEPFEFADAIDMCHSMMALQAREKNIALTRDIDKSVNELCADRRAVQQMLINLVSNAVKFTPEGGRVHITADVKDGRLRFRVNDNGIGIAAEDLDKIGQPFMQVQNTYTRQYEGTGLGLSLVKGLVALHEGDMMIDSAPGCGTTVSISLPLDGPAPKDAEIGYLEENVTKLETGESADEPNRKQA